VGQGTIAAVDPITVCTGGIVSNSAIALTRLGMRVAALGYVGDDHWGTMFRQVLQTEGIDTSHVMNHSITSTTTAIVLIDSTGQRSFAYYPGATEMVDRHTLLDRLELFRQSQVALIGYYSLLPKLDAALSDVLQAIRETGCQTALDSAGNGGRLQPLDRALPHLDIYVPSHKEAISQTSETDPAQAIEVYRQCGATGLLGIKLGPDGALLSPAPGQYVRIDAVAPPGPIVDTTGAGDAFYAGLLTGLLRGLSPADAGRLGAATASHCITAKGATPGLHSYDETMKLAGLSRHH
jgi:sugar/nucleoside kinase (ribokinase family)